MRARVRSPGSRGLAVIYNIEPCVDTVQINQSAYDFDIDTQTTALIVMAGPTQVFVNRMSTI